MEPRLLIGGQSVSLGRKAITLPPWAVDYLKEGSKPKQVAGRFMESNWAYRCITIRANSLSSIPWQLQKVDKDPNTENVAVLDHPLSEILLDVNPEMSWVDLIRATESDLCIYGASYWEKVRAGRSGKSIKSLQRLNPSTMSVVSNKAGIQGFKQALGGDEIEFERDAVVYFKLYHPTDDLGGFSPLMVALASVDAEINAEKYVAAFFKNHALPPTILVPDEGTVTDAEVSRFSRWWNKTFRGVDKAHKIGILSKKMDVIKLGFSPEELALDTIRAEARKNICGAFGVPPAIAGAWESATYNASPEQRRSMYEDTIIPQAAYIASVINAELVKPWGEQLEFAWEVDQIPIMQESETERVGRLVSLVNAGIIRKEVAAVEAGFSKDDVPEPQPVPDFTPGGGDDGDEDEPEDNLAKSITRDLDKYRRKVQKRIKEGSKAKISFESDFIPESLYNAIYGALGAAKTVSDVDSIFDNAIRWDGYP